MKELAKLLENLSEFKCTESSAHVEVAGVENDSRQVKPGFVFVCITGFAYDGHEFIGSAIDNGAKVIVVEKDVPEKPGIIYVRVPDTRVALSQISAAFYDYPAKQLSVVGVTGTNGKTTTTYMVEAIMRKTGYKTGLIGTIQNKVGDELVPTERTTPESSYIQGLFRRVVDSGASHAVMEVSSHALDLQRVHDVPFAVGIFTNLTQDHLDYHKTMEGYKLAKSKLFQILRDGGTGVVNIDDAAGEYMIDQCVGKVLTYGIEREADIRASEIEVGINGVAYTLTTPAGKTRLNLKFTGYFNVYNSLGAVGAGLALGIPLETVKAGLEGLAGVAGRFEQVTVGQKFGVIVDYAHTPDGMENVLKTATDVAGGRKIVVFGAGGDRDRTKRPIMGRVASEYGDVVIVTSDNPRTEDPERILKDIEEGIVAFQKEKQRTVNYQLVADRREAIFTAIREAQPGDLVLLLGKGHETYQVLKDETIHFDDHEVAEEAIRSL